MANVRVSQEDFENVAIAANNADRKGDQELALALDKLARKINAALTRRENLKWTKMGPVSGQKQIGWEDVPSILVSEMLKE